MYIRRKTVVEQVDDPVTQISLANAKMIDSKYDVDDIVNVEVKSKEFGQDCYAECKECHFTEDQGRRKKSDL